MDCFRIQGFIGPVEKRTISSMFHGYLRQEADSRWVGMLTDTLGISELEAQKDASTLQLKIDYLHGSGPVHCEFVLQDDGHWTGTWVGKHYAYEADCYLDLLHPDVFT